MTSSFHENNASLLPVCCLGNTTRVRMPFNNSAIFVLSFSAHYYQCSWLKFDRTSSMKRDVVYDDNTSSYDKLTHEA